jgi:hypothetical protein
MTVQRLGRLIADGDVDQVRSAVENNPRLVARTVERAGQGGWTPLHVAVVERQPEIARVLVDAGADIGARTEHGRTPLHVALRFAPEVAPVLLELGAVVDAPSAAFLDDVDTLTRQLDGGTRPNDRASGADLLSWAAFGGAPTSTAARCGRPPGADGWTSSGCSWTPGPTSTAATPPPGGQRCTPWRRVPGATPPTSWRSC